MQTALITGASSGIGAELARVFARNGYRLVLTARREERLRELASELGEGRITVIAADLCAPEGARALHDRVTQAGIHVDVLVNNAGLGGFGLFAGQSPERQAEMMQVNMVALTCLTRLFLPPMIGRHRGGILNVASMAAYQPGPLMSVYYASKAYVLSLSEALAEEVRGQGVVVTALCPGPVHTEFGKVAGVETFGELEQLAVDVRTVAEQAFAGFSSGKRVVIPGWRNRLLAILSKVAPRSLAAKVVMALQGSKVRPYGSKSD